MKIQLNLMPQAVLARRERAARRRLLVGLPLIVLALLVAPYVLLAQQEADARRAVRLADEQLAPLRAVAAQVAQLQSQTEELERQLTATRAALQQHRRWSGVLADMGRIVPQDAWLQSMLLESGRITVSGFALELRSVALFVQSVSLMPAVAQVQVPALQQTLVGPRNVLQFQVVARLKEASP